MNSIHIWELGQKISIKPKDKFLRKINRKIRKKFKSKEKLYSILKKSNNVRDPLATFKNFLKYSYYKGQQHAPLEIFLSLCKFIDIEKGELESNIVSYKTRKGYSIINKPILPIKINPYFDMIIAHNIADGTVINPKKKRQLYFGYRQFDKKIRILYVKKLNAIFGDIRFKTDYFNKTTRPYCPAVLSQLFFKHYKLDSKSFLSKRARIPKEILGKEKDFLLSFLIAFIIDEGNVDSTLICIRLKNPELTRDLLKICNKLGYKSSFNIKKGYGNLYILREGMAKLYSDYKELVRIYPLVHMGYQDTKIFQGLKVRNREIYKTKGNRDLILKMLKKEDLTVNQIARRINMTRQGARFHIHNLEDSDKIFKNGFTGKKNIVYSYEEVIR